MIAFRTHRRSGSHIECRYALMSFGIPTSTFPLTSDDRIQVGQSFKQWIETQRRLDEMRESSETPSSIAGLFHNRLDTDDASFSPGKRSSTGSVSPALLSLPQPLESIDSSRCLFQSSSDLAPPLTHRSDDTPEIKVEVEPMARDILLGRGKPLQRHPGNVRFRQLIASHADKYELGDRFQKTLIAADVVATIRESDGRFLKPRGKDGWEKIDDETARLKVAHTFRTLRKSKKKSLEGLW
jgi:hypothetical protein